MGCLVANVLIDPASLLDNSGEFYTQPGDLLPMNMYVVTQPSCLSTLGLLLLPLHRGHSPVHEGPGDHDLQL